MRTRAGLLWALALFGLTSEAAEPELSDVYPMGARVDSVLEVEVGSTLADLSYAVFDGEGVKAKLLGPVKEVRVNAKKGKAVEKPVPNRYRFEVTVDKDVQPGLFALRVGSAARMSEPLSFEVGAMDEVSLAVTNRAGATKTALGALPVCVNGRVFGAETNRYLFQVKKGAALVAFAEGRVLPCGVKHPSVSFETAEGLPCEGVSVYNGATAPVAVFEVPQDGTYALSVAGVSESGKGGTAYRIKLGELPLVTGFAPRGAKAGESLNVQLTGVNLKQKRVRLFTGGKNSELCLKTVAADALVLPALRFELSDENNVLEQEPNDAPETAQPLEPPCVVNGELKTADARDVYRFSGKKGESLYVDVRSEALGSPLELRVTVRNARGEVVAAGCFDTHATAQAACGRDPSVPLTISEDGVYSVEVADLRGRGGDECVYRLSVGPPEPDYRLWMSPASINIPAEGSARVMLFVQRIHGFAGPIQVKLDFPPLSIACEGGAIPAGATQWAMTVSTDGARYPKKAFELSLTGSAQIGDREVRRPAVPMDFARDAVGQLCRCECGDAFARVNTAALSFKIDCPAQTPVSVNAREPVRLALLGAVAKSVGAQYVPVVVWPSEGLSASVAEAVSKQDRVGVWLRTDGPALKTGQTGSFILGCYKRDDPDKKIVAISQSVLFVVQ